MNLSELALKYPKHYYLKEYKESDQLIVAFGNAGALNGVFPFYKTLHNISACSFFLISGLDVNAWYSNGLPGLGDNLECVLNDLADCIQSYCEKLDIKKCYFVGASMGGYPALLITHFIQRNSLYDIKYNVVCFCTETCLFLKNSRSEYHNNIVYFKDLVNGKYVDINALCFNADEITMYFGERCIVDSYCALRLKEQQLKFFNKPIRLISCRDAGHLILPYLDMNRGYIKHLFQELLLYNSFFILHEGTMSEHLCSEDVYGMIDPDVNSEQFFITMKKIVQKYPNYAFGLNRLGVCYEKREDYSNAFKFLTMSAIEDPSLENTKIHLDYVRKHINL